MERINYPSEGLYYEGEVSGGIPDGQGIFYYVDGKPCKGGVFVDGKLQGKGWIYFEDGSIFKGEFKNELPDGKGKVYYSNGKLAYEGTFVEGYRSGQGVEYNEDGKKSYIGSFLNGKYSGEGKQFEPLTERLWMEGTYENGVIVNGRYYNDGRLGFEGEFYPQDTLALNFKKGRMYMPDNHIVVDGEFPNTKNTGKTGLGGFSGCKEYYSDFKLSPDGKLVKTNCGDVYNDRPHSGCYVKDGKDTDIVVEFSSTRDLTTGRYLKTVAYDEHNPYRFCQRFDSRGGVKSTFENGHLTEYYFSLDKDKTVEYQGEGKLDYHYPIRHGKGKLYNEKGHLIYEGEFKDGKCSGYGKQYGEDGQITYEGKFLCGKPEEEFKRSPEYSAYLKKEEERKAKEAAEGLKAKKKAKDEKNSKIGCAIIIIIVIILANIL